MIRPLGPQPSTPPHRNSNGDQSLLEEDDMIEAELVDWEDFNDQERLEENMNSLFTCKKVILELQVCHFNLYLLV